MIHLLFGKTRRNLFEQVESNPQENSNTEKEEGGDMHRAVAAAEFSGVLSSDGVKAAIFEFYLLSEAGSTATNMAISPIAHYIFYLSRMLFLRDISRSFFPASAG